MYLKHTHCPA